jgi:hypothetical protein
MRSLYTSKTAKRGRRKRMQFKGFALMVKIFDFYQLFESNIGIDLVESSSIPSEYQQ